MHPYFPTFQHMSEKRTGTATALLKIGRSEVGLAPHPGHGHCHMHHIFHLELKCSAEMHWVACERFFWAWHENDLWGRRRKWLRSAKHSVFLPPKNPCSPLTNTETREICRIQKRLLVNRLQNAQCSLLWPGIKTLLKRALFFTWKEPFTSDGCFPGPGVRM